MKDKNLTLGDLKFIARKREYWWSLAVALSTGLLFGTGIGVWLSKI
jgi:hypothetical protein